MTSDDCFGTREEMIARYRALQADRDALMRDHANLRAAAGALIADVRRRYPGEELRCPFMQALDAAIAKAESTN